MIEISNIRVVGFEAAIRGMRNPMNSWDRSDSLFDGNDISELGKNDLDLMRRLSSAGEDHGKFARMITVYMDILAPLYWWKEFDTYKVGTVADSCSTMHKIAEKRFFLTDFSTEYMDHAQRRVFMLVLEQLNHARDIFNASDGKNKTMWYGGLIQMLPSSYNQKRTIATNYQTLKRMYDARKNHKLSEWRAFCAKMHDLPYFDDIFFEGTKNDD